MLGWGGLLGLTLVSGRLGQAPRWVYVDQGDSWIARGLGTCAGDRQSPIGFADVTSTTTVGIGDLAPSPDLLWYRYPPVGYPLRLVNDGHTLTVTFPEQYKGGVGVSSGSTVSDMLQEARHFRLYKLNVHHPSEHTLNGEQFPLELHLLHQNPTTKQTGILAVWVKPGKPSPLLADLLQSGLPEKPFDEVTFNRNAQAPQLARSGTPVGFDLGSHVMRAPSTDAPGVMAYEGSLTEPPCEQPVQWWVRRAPLEASLDQIQQLAKLIRRVNANNGNFRKLQQLHGRTASLMAVVDQEDGAIPPPPAVPAPSGQSTAETTVPCSSLPEFGTVAADDSPDAAVAKQDFQLAKQNFEATGTWVAAAKQALKSSQDLYDAAPGPVEKINLKWDVIAKQTDLGTATAALAPYTAALKAACQAALPSVCGVANASDACVDAMAAAGTEAVTATATVNSTASQDEAIETGLDYGAGEVRLPTAEAGNPFSNTVAERESRIAPGRMPLGYRDLSTSLRQPLAPDTAVAQAKPPADSANATNTTR